MAGQVAQQKRIKKERERFLESPIDGITLLASSTTDVWQIRIEGAVLAKSLYSKESFTLNVRFTEQYPFDSPEVKFVGDSPCHAHIYSNGHICLNILGTEWSPALTVSSVVISIVSMLSSATLKSRPEDNERYVRTHSSSHSPKDTHFMYHDDTV